MALPIHSAPAQKATAKAATKARQAIEVRPLAAPREAPPKATFRGMFRSQSLFYAAPVERCDPEEADTN
ncbi:hypothetical protein [Phenylobacterium sp.]|uniref:hypothetical protein n=1 Tax=Phenylobacterium sp. TaxID=1871053 RepID=UPI00086DE35E|nr:MAG: hypothetical protein ABS77_05640 [Phenylobacterium sp. SCN 69-14]